MKGKKLLAGLLAVSTALTMAGCSTAKNKNTEEGEITTLKMYMVGAEKPDTKLVIEEVNKLLREKIGAELEWNLIASGMMSEKINMIYAANENFDLCFTGYANPLNDAVVNGCLLELDELIEEHTPDLKGKLPDYLWKAASIDGKIYAVPNQQINAIKTVAQIFESDKEKFGLDFSNVKCPADLEPVLAKIKASGTDRIPFRGGSSPQIFADADTLGKYEVLGNGTALNLETLKVENLYKTDYFVSGMKRTRDWYEKGYIRTDIASVIDDDADWLAKRYVVALQSWRPASDNDPNWEIRFPGEKPVNTVVVEPYLTTSICDSTMLSISANSKNPVKAIKYIDLINTDAEVYNLLSYGIEDKHWEWTDENKTHIRLTAPDLYQPNSAWAYGNQFNSYVIEGNPIDIWEKEKELNLSSEYSPVLGLRFDNSNLTTPIAQINAVLTDYTKLMKGYGDWKDAYPEMLNRLEEAGIDKVIKEYQSQVDEFFKNNKYRKENNK